MGLFKPFWMKEATDTERINKLAEKVKELDITQKIEAAKNAPMWQLRKAAIEGIDDQEILSEIISNESNDDVRTFTIGKISDSSVIKRILEENAKSGTPSIQNRKIISNIFEATSIENRKPLFLAIPQYNRSLYIDYLCQEDICQAIIWANSDNDMYYYAEHLYEHESMIKAILGICNRGWAYSQYGLRAIEVMFKKLNEDERAYIIEKTKDADSVEKGKIISICYEERGMNSWG